MFVRGRAAEPLDPEVVEALSKVQTSTLGHLRDYGFPEGTHPDPPAVELRSARRSPCGCAPGLQPRCTSRPTSCAPVTCSSSTSPGTPGPVSAAWWSFTAATRGAVGAVISGAINDVGGDPGAGSAGVLRRRVRADHPHPRHRGRDQRGRSPWAVRGHPGRRRVRRLGRDRLCWPGVGAGDRRDPAGQESPSRSCGGKISEGTRLSEWSGALAAFEASSTPARSTPARCGDVVAGSTQPAAAPRGDRSVTSQPVAPRGGLADDQCRVAVPVTFVMSMDRPR